MEMNNLTKTFAIAIPVAIAVLGSPVTLGSDTTGGQETRPRVGLVLSGGGARGAAHVGVLKVLEEMRIPVDYVAGTSMGSIVGGLYASGMSPEEIEAAFGTYDWAGVFKSDLDRKDLSFRRKRDDDFLLVKAKPGFDIKTAELKLPTGFLQGQKVNLILHELTLPVAEVDDFDKLLIPFRAVATDIGTGKAAVLGEGKLAAALRASMAVPGGLAPEIIDGRMLVDGGVSNNLPIDVARNMGADVLIVVDISTPLMEASEITDIISVTEQLTNIMTRSNTDVQLATLTTADITILPNLGDIATADFNRVLEAIPAGYSAADSMRAELAGLAVSNDEFRHWLAVREGRSTVPPMVNFIHITNDSGLNEDALLARVQHPVGVRLDEGELGRDLNRIYGLDLFENVSYDIVEENDQSGLLITARAKQWGPDYLQFGLNLETDFDGESKFNMDVAYLKTNMNARGAEWRSGVTMGQDPGLFTEWYQPIDKGLHYFVNPRAGFSRRSVNVFENSNKVAEYRIEEFEIRLDAGRELGDWGELRMGYFRSEGQSELGVGDPGFQDVNSDEGGFFGQIQVDRMNNQSFPTEGYSLNARLTRHDEDFGDDNNFDQAVFSFAKPMTWDRYTVIPAFEGGATLKGSAPVYGLFEGGGFLRLSGFETNELSGDEFAIAKLIAYRRMNDITFLPVYLGASLEYGDYSDDLDLNDFKTAGSLFVGVDSFFGPLYVGTGVAEGGSSTVFMFLGKIF
jgi:NTE family protein